MALAILLALSILQTAGFAQDRNEKRPERALIAERKTAGKGFIGIAMVPTSVPGHDGGVAMAIRIVHVVPGSAAEDVGLQYADTITAVDGNKLGPELTITESFTKYVTDKSPGDVIELSISRDGKSKKIKVTLGARPEELDMKPLDGFDQPRDQSGIKLKPTAEIEIDPPDDASPSEGRNFELFRIRGSQRPSGGDTKPRTPNGEGAPPPAFSMIHPDPWGDGTERVPPDQTRLETLGQAVRDAKGAEDQLIYLVAYCADLTRDLPNNDARFDGLEFHFHNADLKQLNPRRNPRDIGETHIVSLLFVERRTEETRGAGKVGRPVPVELLFRPVDASVVKKLTNFRLRLYQLFKD